MRFTAPAQLDLRRSLAWYRHGAGDPTTRLDRCWFARATHTPDGPATLWMSWARVGGAPDGSGHTPQDIGVGGDRAPGGDQVATFELIARAWGDGANWLVERAPRLAGVGYEAPTLPPRAAARLCRLARQRRGVTTGASGTLYHELLPTILAQRITARQAIDQWRRLVWSLGAPAPGPLGLRLPPAPETMARLPSWALHRLGIERTRADALRHVARHAATLWEWADTDASRAAHGLACIPGVGPWTVGSVLGPALGDDDAVAVGDFHLPNLVAWSLAGEPRADDRRMLELLAPYPGQRGRIIRLLTMAGYRAPARGPRRRILAIERM